MKDAIASGMSDNAALKVVPGAPSSAAWTRYLQNRPERAAEIAAVRRPKGRPSLDRIAENFHAMMARIAEGHSAVSAGRELGINGEVLTDFLLAHPGRREAYAEAMKKRARVLGIRTTVRNTRVRKPFAKGKFEEAIAVIARTHEASWVEALARAGLPSNGSLQGRARKDPEFRRRLTHAIAAHAANTHHLRYVRDGADPKLLLASLLKDELFAKLWAKFKRYPDSRHDMVAEAYAAILAGEMTFADLGKKKPANTITKRAIGNSLAFASLDAPTYGDDESRDNLVDTIASPSPILFY
ncbi:hypothetical protein [Bradyrhizobium pachyrhizi]|uniref:hypothetical protein n=1 Tax=Bradyrhizobium pachyrhizi TaxID=280333 RepID=UPI003D35F382